MPSDPLVDEALEHVFIHSWQARQNRDHTRWFVRKSIPHLLKARSNGLSAQDTVPYLRNQLREEIRMEFGLLSGLLLAVLANVIARVIVDWWFNRAN